jgi:hypothetical protein
MKKQVLYILLLFAFISCQEEVKFNNPSFQGLKDNVFWRAVASKATFSNNVLTIEAYTRNEKVTLITNSKNPGTYILGINNLNIATYVLEDSNPKITFKTEAGIGEVDGEIVIEKYDEVNKTVTGTFKFNAVNVTNNPLAGPLLNFQYGHFYKVPVK